MKGVRISWNILPGRNSSVGDSSMAEMKMRVQPFGKRSPQFAWLDWMLLLASGGLSVHLLAALSRPAIVAWRNHPRPGAQVFQQCRLKETDSAHPTAIPINYLLYLPPNYTTMSKWPLVVYLHGSAARGYDLELVQREWLPNQIIQGKQFNFILVSPQCPAIFLGWSPECVIGLIEHLSQTLSVDRDRVYLTGYSMGGYGVWATAINDPGRFAAVAPLCGGGDTVEAERLKNMPIWAFHGEKDDIVPLETGQAMVDAVKKCGGYVKFTVYPGVGHNISSASYMDEHFLEWLLAQRRRANYVGDESRRHNNRHGDTAKSTVGDDDECSKAPANNDR